MTRPTKYIFVALAALITVIYLIVNLKGEKTLVQARYLMLACENCDHMEIVKSTDENIVAQTIIPESNTYSIEELISNTLKDKSDLCLEGYAYKFNTANIWRIDPPGIRFKVENSYPLSKCENLNSKDR